MTGNDVVPEFHAQTLPPGSAPQDRTFAPNTTSETPSQANNPDASTYTPASETLGGATSGDVYRGLGKPIQGQTATEERHDGQHGRKHVGGGLTGLGASGAPSGMKGVDERLQPEQRGLEKEEAGGTAGRRGDKGQLAAEDLPNVQAEHI